MRNPLLIFILLAFQFGLLAQNTDYLFVVTTDGLRWQEVFEGADSLLLASVDEPEQAAYFQKYFAPAPETRRKLLMPFFWTTLAQNGQIYGNRNYDNKVSVSNRYQISYPSYSEIFCGYADNAHIMHNMKKQNPNINVLEWINQREKHQGKVKAIGSWDVFPYILNEKRSKLSVNAAFEKLENNHVPAQVSERNRLNKCLETTVRRWKSHLRPDTLTWEFAKYIVKTEQPNVVYIGFGETDEYAHEGNYAGYLDAIARFDSLLSECWSLIQNSEKYRGKSSLLVTTDHGRGQKNWRMHSCLTAGSEEIWMAVASPEFESRGEMRVADDIKQAQLAQTIAALVGLRFECTEHPVAARVEQIFERSESIQVQPVMSVLKPSPLDK